MDRAQWAKRQVAALIDMGDDALDAEAWVAQLLALIPEDQDPATYQLSADEVAALSSVTDEAVQSARVEWYAADWVPGRYKRLLDGTERAAEVDWDPDLHPRDEDGKFSATGGGLPEGISIDAFGNYGQPRVWRTVNRMVTPVGGQEAKDILASPAAQAELTRQREERAQRTERERTEREDRTRREQAEKEARLKQRAEEEATRAAAEESIGAARAATFADPHAPTADSDDVPVGRRYLGVDSRTGLAVARYGVDELHDSDVRWGGFRQRIAEDAVSQNGAESIRVYGLERPDGGLQAIASTERTDLNGKPAIGVNFLASAGITQGEGTSMMAYLCQQAASEGAGLTLHAAISAEGFYQHLGMTVISPRTSGDLTVYGFTARQARNFARARYGK